MHDRFGNDGHAERELMMKGNEEQGEAGASVSKMWNAKKPKI